MSTVLKYLNNHIILISLPILIEFVSKFVICEVLCIESVFNARVVPQAQLIKICVIGKNKNSCSYSV